MKISVILSSCLGVIAAGPVVNLGYAKYEGSIDAQNNITSFLGVRYAAPPTGNLRWRAPTPPPSVQGTVQQAASQPPRCYQGALGTNLTGNPVLAGRAIEDSEDCLFLNVYSPALTPQKLLPTIVWIHGGGYALGAASDYNGAELVLESNKNVVVVVIQYRLGIFGFLAGKQVHGDGSANAGLLDQDFALRWVNKNIHKFGGDPNKVAIWGQSAGAGSVIQHVLAHNGKTEPKLFRAAIASSTYVASQYPYDHWVPQTRFNQAAELAGCPNSTALDCLRTIDSGTLAEINLNISLASYQGTLPFLPVVDGSFITQSPLIQLQKGKVNGDVLLSVTNTNEGNLFLSPDAEYNIAEYARNVLPALSVPQSKSVARVYSSLGSPLEQAQAILKEANFVCPSYYTLAAFPGKSYKGQFAIPPALHGDDVSYYFPSFAGFGPPTPRFNNTDFISAFVGGFLSFAVNLDPNETLLPSIAPTWPKWSAAKEELVFNKTNSADPQPAIALQKVDEGLLGRCEFWKALRIQTSQ
ncbi:Alpha/Beta hydrolase protein [Mycena amicta]|nr:Alpha/Beta hydrolase protein [Mycena amicta]